MKLSTINTRELSKELNWTYSIIIFKIYNHVIYKIIYVNMKIRNKYRIHVSVNLLKKY